MAAGSANLLRWGRSGQWTAELREYEAVYQVITTDKSDGPATVNLASGLPRLGDMYSVGNETDANAKAIEIDPRQDRDKSERWEITVRFSNQSPDPSAIQQGQQNPALEPAVVRWSKEEYREVVETDRNGKKICNVNGQMFDPPLEKTKYRPVLLVERNFLNFPDSYELDYPDSENSDAFFGKPPGHWVVRELYSEPRYANGFNYKRVFAAFVYYKNGCATKLLNQGFLYKATTATTILIEDKARRKPVLLNSTGVRIADGSTIGPGANDATMLNFELGDRLPFNALGII